MGVATFPRGGKPDLPVNNPCLPLHVGLAALLGTFALGGCATYSSSFGSIERSLSNREYDAALQDIEKQSGSRTDRVLYFLNKGMVLRMKRDFVGSNQSLEAAKAEMERLYAASVSNHNAQSFFVNDARVSYVGDDYEQVLVHIYMALNYLELGQPDDARVEALQVDVKLREISKKNHNNEFTEDAFSRYLTGMIYEERGEWSDAMIAYRKAYEAYQKYRGNYSPTTPTMLKYDLLRLAQREGLSDEVARYKKEFGIDLPHDKGSPLKRGELAKQGELVFVLDNGLSPIKREDSINNKAKSAYGPPLLVKLPIYESRRNDVVVARISVSGKEAYTELMEDIDAIAKKTLNSHMPTIVARSMARTMINEQASMIGLLNSLVMQVTAMFTERADTRSWLTLPSNIQLARLTLLPGSYTVKVELLGADAKVVATSVYPDVVITQARKTYLTKHWIPAQLSSTRRL